MIVIRAIKPGKPFQSSIFRDEVKREAEAIRKDILDDFKRTTATWQHKPKFTSKVEMGATVGGVKIEVSTKDTIYGYVDQGTRPHIIRPKRKKALAFPGGQYKPKTQPQVILSTPGGVGGKTIVRPEVHHPGTKARNFSKVIKQSYSKTFRARMQNALDRAARRFK
jgi:hypothetical protein